MGGGVETAWKIAQPCKKGAAVHSSFCLAKLLTWQQGSLCPVRLTLRKCAPLHQASTPLAISLPACSSPSPPTLAPPPTLALCPASELGLCVLRVPLWKVLPVGFGVKPACPRFSRMLEEMAPLVAPFAVDRFLLPRLPERGGEAGCLGLCLQPRECCCGPERKEQPN